MKMVGETNRAVLNEKLVWRWLVKQRAVLNGDKLVWRWLVKQTELC